MSPPPGKQCEGECGSPDSLESDLSQVCRRGVPHGRTTTASALSLLRCFRGPRAGARLPCQRTSTADRNGPYATRAITWRWSRWCSSPAAQTKIACGNGLASAGFHDDLFAGLFEGRMKFRNDSKKSRWDLGRHGFWSKKSIRELLSLLLLRHGMV